MPQAEGPAVVFKSVVTFLILALVSGGSALVAFTVEHTAYCLQSPFGERTVAVSVTSGRVLRVSRRIRTLFSTALFIARRPAN